MSVLSKFNPYAMIKPESEEDIVLILNEVISEMKIINNLFEKVLSK